MRVSFNIWCVFGLVMVLFGCRSEFEQVRTDSTPADKLKVADEYFEAGEYTRAISLYEAIIPAFRGKSEAEGIAFNYAQAHYKDGSYLLSGHYFKSFADTYGASPKKEAALYRSALSYAKMSPRYQLDQADTDKAIDAFQRFINEYPQSDKVAECNDRIDQLRAKMEKKAFQAGKLYYHTRNYGSAIQELENMLKDFPESSYDREARNIIVMASKDWADNSVYIRKEERYRKTIERCNAFLKRHSGADGATQVEKIKNNCEKELNKIKNG